MRSIPSLVFVVLLTACGSPKELDQPNPPPEWPLDNITDVKRTPKKDIPAIRVAPDGTVTVPAPVEPPAPVAPLEATDPEVPVDPPPEADAPAEGAP